VQLRTKKREGDATFTGGGGGGCTPRPRPSGYNPVGEKGKQSQLKHTLGHWRGESRTGGAEDFNCQVEVVHERVAKKGSWQGKHNHGEKNKRSNGEGEGTPVQIGFGGPSKEQGRGGGGGGVQRCRTTRPTNLWVKQALLYQEKLAKGIDRANSI